MELSRISNVLHLFTFQTSIFVRTPELGTSVGVRGLSGELYYRRIIYRPKPYKKSFVFFIFLVFLEQIGCLNQRRIKMAHFNSLRSDTSNDFKRATR